MQEPVCCHDGGLSLNPLQDRTSASIYFVEYSEIMIFYWGERRGPGGGGGVVNNEIK
jgi:hypothetical protein